MGRHSLNVNSQVIIIQDHELVMFPVNPDHIVLQKNDLVLF